VRLGLVLRLPDAAAAAALLGEYAAALGATPGPPSKAPLPSPLSLVLVGPKEQDRTPGTLTLLGRPP